MNSLQKYQQYRGNIRPGDLISFSSHPSLISKSKHTYSAIVIDHIGPTGQRLIIIKSLRGGPVPHYLSDRIKQYKGDIWHFPLKYVPIARRNKAVEYTWDQVLRGTKDSGLVQMAWEYSGIMDKLKKALNPGELIKLDFLGTGIKLN